MVFAFPFWNKTSTICPKLERNVTAASAPHDDSQKQRTRNTNTNNINTEYQLYTNIQIYQLYTNKSFFSILKQNQNKSFQITKRCNSYCISSARWFSKTKNNTSKSIEKTYHLKAKSTRNRTVKDSIKENQQRRR